jgi:hypothetical protein
MPVRLTTAKLTPATLQAARLIAAKTGEKQYEVAQRVLEAEARRLGLLPPRGAEPGREPPPPS